jgi:rhomboid protease GluP
MTYPTTPPAQTPRPAAQPRLAPPRAKMVIGLMVVTGVIFALQNLSILLLGDDYLIAFGAKSNPDIINGELWRLVTPIFLHAPLFYLSNLNTPLISIEGIIHIGFNMYALYIIGPGLERFYGQVRFLLLYMLGGIAGNIASFYFSADPSIGASTAIFGIIAAQGVLIYRNREIFGAQARPLLTRTLTIIVINLVLGASISGVDNWGHVGGLIGGFAFAWFAGPLLKRQTVLLDYGGSATQAYPSLETPLPQYAVRLVDQVLQNQVWMVALLEFLVLGGLTLLRILRAF